jgi:uncharacterized protein YaeQ
MGLRRNLNLDLVITNEAREFYGVEERIFMRKNAGESLTHVLMKLVSYLIFYHPDLLIEESVGQRYKPDLVRLNDYDEPVQWIDCGTTSLKKLEQISRDNTETLIDIVKPTERELRLYKQQADERLSHPERVRYITFEPGFLDRLGAMIERRHTITAVVPPSCEHLYLSVDGRPVRTSVTIWRGAESAD